MVIRVATPDDWREWRTLRLAALRDAPDASLADWADAPEERWRARLEGSHNVLADLGVRLEYKGLNPQAQPHRSG